MKDLLEANHWELADRWMTADYHQHNPNVASGREPVVKFFTSIRKPSPIPQHMKTKIVAVVAEGDLVIVVTPRELPNPKDPSTTYTTSWFDMWRFKGGKADEHWDGSDHLRASTREDELSQELVDHAVPMQTVPDQPRDRLDGG